MSVWKSIFTAELRRSRVFFLIFLLLKALFCAVMVAVLMRRPWTEDQHTWVEIIPPSLLGASSLCLAAIGAFRGAWLDSPTRGGSHLAFRPVSHRVVASALFTAWLLMFVLPAALIEGLLIRHYEFPMRTVMLGSLQTGFVTALVLLNALWIGWMWENKLRLALGLGLFVAAYFQILFFFAFIRGSLPAFIANGIEIPQFAPIWFITTTFLGFFLLVLHSRQPIRGWVRVIAAPATIYAALVLVGLIGSFLPRPASYRGLETSGPQKTLAMPAIVSAGYSKGSSRRDPALLQMQPPTPTSLPVDQRVEWRLTKLSANGAGIQNFLPDPRTMGVVMDNYPNLASYNALSRHLGDKIMIDRGIPSSREAPAQGQLRESNGILELRDLSCELTGAVTRWTITGDRPLRPSETSGRILLNQRYFLWIVPGTSPWSYGDWRERHYLYSPTTGLLTELPPRGGISHAGFGVDWLTPDNYDPLKRPYLGHRLISLRPETIGTLKTSVTIPGDTVLRKQEDNGELPLHGPDAVKALETWLTEHPAPAMDAPEAVISAWLRQFLPLIPMPDRQPVPSIKEIIVSVAESHPVLLLETLNKLGRNSTWANLNVSQALPKSLVREAIIRRPNTSTSEPRGGLQPGDEKLAQALGPYAAMKARRGESFAVLEILFSVPEAVGLTHAEWLDVFRLHPSARSYNALRKVGVPETELGQEIAGLLEHRFPLSYRENNVLEDRSGEGGAEYSVEASATGSRDAFSNISKGSVPDVELALASGHPQAVEWYARCYQSLMNWRDIHLPAFSAMGSTNFTDAADSLRRYFVVPEDIPLRDTKRHISWFLEHPPEDFTFDPTIRKFRLK